MKIIFRIVFCLIIVSVSSASAMVLPRTALKPVIDGDLNDEMWREVPKIQLCNINSNPLVNNTEAAIAFDNENLYISFKCYESRMDMMKKAWDHVEERDNSIWADDCVEIFIDPLASSTRHFYHIIINSSSVIYDARAGNISWNGDIDVATKYHKDYWVVEFSIPLINFGYAPRGGEVWTINLCRDAKPSGEWSALKPVASYTDYTKFEEFEFEADSKAVGFSVQSIAENGKSNLKLKIKNNQAEDSNVDVLLNLSCKGDNVFSEKKPLAVKANSDKTFVIPYKSIADFQTLELKAFDGNNEIYSNQLKFYPPVEVLATTGKSDRVWNVQSPLYKELLTDEPSKLAKQGAMYWYVERDYNGMRKFAMQYGFRYSYEESYQMLAANNLHPVTTLGVLESKAYNSAEYDRKYGVKEIYTPDWRDAGVPKVGDSAFLLDPVCKKAFIDDLKNALGKYSDVIWAVLAGDEVFPRVSVEGINVFEQKKNEYPYIVEVDKQVKEQFGNGIYGIPTSMNDKHPLRWMAYRKWLNRELADFLAEIHTAVKKDWPDVLVISYDPLAMGSPFDFSRWSNSCDIMTHQLYPRRTSDRASFGYITKLVRDISGKEEVWPCMHVEEYSASFTPQEALELLSQPFRNGATGIHYYLKDTVGRRTKHKYLWTEYYGAPDRWQLEMSAVEQAAKLNKLKFPEPDFAILFSCDSYNALPVNSDTENVECAYTLLGPGAGSWFTFINDYQIERDEIDIRKFKAIYVPYAQYQARSVVMKLQRYVDGGGILIAGDPKIFDLDTKGKDASVARHKLFGVKNLNDCRVKNINYGQSVLPVTGKAYDIGAVSGADVLAVFDDNKPALISRKFGKGKTYYFATNPFTYQSLKSTEWFSFFRDFQKTLDLRLDNDIWRFKFPDDLIKPLPQPAGKCLTNNYIAWRQFNALKDSCVNTDGSYWYSVAPDEVGEQSQSEKISFSEGDLTDRHKAPAAGNVDAGQSNLNDWIVKYSKARVEPFDITFDFKQQFDISKLVIYYSGQLPGVVVAASNDGENWQSCDKVIDKTAFTEDVFDVEIDGISSNARYVKISFASRDTGNSLTLAEIEVWAK